MGVGGKRGVPGGEQFGGDDGLVGGSGGSGPVDAKCGWVARRILVEADNLQRDGRGRLAGGGVLIAEQTSDESGGGGRGTSEQFAGGGVPNAGVVRLRGARQQGLPGVIGGGSFVFVDILAEGFDDADLVRDAAAVEDVADCFGDLGRTGPDHEFNGVAAQAGQTAAQGHKFVRTGFRAERIQGDERGFHHEGIGIIQQFLQVGGELQPAPSCRRLRRWQRERANADRPGSAAARR